MKEPKEKWVRFIPNILSGYRLLAIIPLVWLLVNKSAPLFALLLCISLVTDILDGFIARRFNVATELGARLDSIADLLTIITAALGVYTFKMDDLAPLLIQFYIYLGLLSAQSIISLLRFRRFPSLHTYMNKTAGYGMGIFFFILFAVGMHVWLWHVVITLAIIAATEALLILLSLDKAKSNVKSIFHINN